MTETSFPLILIVAYARNRVIGRDNQLPWHLPADLAHFKRNTLGHPIIMGRRTFQSLPGILPQRRHLVLSRDRSFQAVGAEVVGSLDQAVNRCREAGATRAYVIGGADIFAMALPQAQMVLATEIDAEVAGDTFFPALDADWHETAREAQPAQNGLAFDFVTYERR